MQSVSTTDVQSAGGAGALTAIVGPDQYEYLGPGQIMLRDADQSPVQNPMVVYADQSPVQNPMVVYALERYGARPYWDTLLSDRTLGIMARRVRQVAQEALSSQFGYFETTEYPFIWSETRALQNLMYSVDTFANVHPPQTPPTKEQLSVWWRDLVWFVAQEYADNVRQGLLYKQRLTDGPVNPGLVARPRVSDSAAGHRELNTAPYVLSHPWGHNGQFPMR